MKIMIQAVRNLLLLCLICAVALAAPRQDEVTTPYAGYTEHKWYSGYLNFSTGHYHYVFFDSQRDPDNDPVVLWLNGGPGCSSLIGMVLENGPFVFKTNSTNFRINQWAWNKKANLLYIQTPGGVGFSKSFRNNTYNDNTVTEDNYRALVDFFRKFINLRKNEFYITGQSYAGIYVPYLALYITQQNRLPNREVTINLKGIMVGNACTNTRECFQPSSEDSMSIFQYEYLHNHGYITDRDYDYITGACILGYRSAGCKSIRNKTDTFFAATQTVINNIYQPCYHQLIPNTQDTFLQSRLKHRLLSSDGVYKTCQDLIGIISFFNQPTIHNALHVDFVKYDICSDQVEQKYKMNENASEWIYPILIREKIRILVYSGDVDANVPIVGTLRWIEGMRDVQGVPIEEPWREWWVPGLHKHEDQVGGMVWKLRGFTFASVKGAGHMVPTNKPKEAQVLLESFITNSDLPEKSP